MFIQANAHWAAEGRTPESLLYPLKGPGSEAQEKHLKDSKGSQMATFICVMNQEANNADKNEIQVLISLM